jgi:hypothetical protein
LNGTVRHSKDGDQERREQQADKDKHLLTGDVAGAEGMHAVVRGGDARPMLRFVLRLEALASRMLARLLGDAPTRSGPTRSGPTGSGAFGGTIMGWLCREADAMAATAGALVGDGTCTERAQ